MVDAGGVPLAVVVVIAIGVGAVGAGPGHLIADDGAADAAEDGAGGPVAASGDGAAQEGADAGSGYRAGHTVVALLAAGLGGRP